MGKSRHTVNFPYDGLEMLNLETGTRVIFHHSCVNPYQETNPVNLLACYPEREDPKTGRNYVNDATTPNCDQCGGSLAFIEP